MQLITHSSRLDALCASPLKDHITARFQDFVETEDDSPPIFVIVEEDDDITGPDYAFVGPDGLLSDLWEEHEPGHSEFCRPYEWISFLSQIDYFEILLLSHGEDGALIFVSKALAEAIPNLKWVLTDESQDGLSDPQPLQ